MQGKVAVCSLLTRNSTYQIALGLDQHRGRVMIDSLKSHQASLQGGGLRK